MDNVQQIKNKNVIPKYTYFRRSYSDALQLQTDRQTNRSTKSKVRKAALLKVYILS